MHSAFASPALFWYRKCSPKPGCQRTPALVCRVTLPTVPNWMWGPVNIRNSRSLQSRGAVSGLAGAAVKTASEAAPIRATINPSASGGLGITGDWENRATFDLLWKETGFDLRLGRLYLGPEVLSDIEINALDLDDRWVVNTSSRRAEGRLVIPMSGETVKADFQVLRLVRSETPVRSPKNY